MSPNQEKMRHIYILILLMIPFFTIAQQGILKGKVIAATSGKPVADVAIILNEKVTFSSTDGTFTIENINFGTYQLSAQLVGQSPVIDTVIISKSVQNITIQLTEISTLLNEVVVEANTAKTLGSTRLRAVEGTAIYESKKNEVIVLKDITANLATNNARQVFAKITGLNIWESDGAGLQLGIGGRGLSPNRTANFNTRQNGYDIAADALGYPESYYTPPVEALERIQVVRGASSLQYGTQFGGMLNFVFKKGGEQKIRLTSRQTIGSWGFLGSFNSLDGTVGKLNYYMFYQHKQGNGWRPNSSFTQQNIFGKFTYNFTENISVTAEYTHSDYLAQQAGGLTDALFKQNPRQSLRERNWFDVNWNTASLSLDWKLTDRTLLNVRNFGLLSSRSSLGNLERINVADLGGNRTLIDGEFENIANETRLIHRYDLGKSYGVFLIGSRFYRGNTTAVQGDGSANSNADFRFLNPENVENSDYDFPNQNIAFFIENIFNISDKFSITPGIRFESIRTEANGYFRQRVIDFAGNIVADNRIDETLKRNRSFLIGGIGATYRPSEKTEVYGNISQNYRAINFTDLRVINPNFSVDPNIKDERGFSADLGIRGNDSDIYNFDVTLFYIAYKNRIGQILQADRPPLFLDYRFRTNVSDARNIGVEAFGEVNFLKLWNPQSKRTLSLFVNGAVVDARYINSQEASVRNKKVEMVPPIMLRTGLSFREKSFTATLQLSHTGEHFTDATNAIRTATAVEGIIPAYQIVDLSASYQWKKLRLEGSINNLLNQAYFTRRAEAYPGPGIIPADGRGFYGTLQLQL
ncbi:MAG: Fe(3+) dicitrate transport protein [Spirosomataceae bacterium]